MLFAFRLWIVSVGLPGLLHSLLALAPVCAAVLAGEYWLRGEWEWAAVGVALIGSYLVLNPVDGGPVLLLFPLVETGIGLQYPARTVFVPVVAVAIITGVVGILHTTGIARAGYRATVIAAAHMGLTATIAVYAAIKLYQRGPVGVFPGVVQYLQIRRERRSA